MGKKITAKTKSKSGFLSVELTRCPKCDGTDINTAHNISRFFGICYYDWCRECGCQFNQKYFDEARDGDV